MKGTCNFGRLRFGEVAVWAVAVLGAVWGSFGAGSCSVGELQCEGVAVWGKCSV